MAESWKSRWWNREILFLSLGCGLATGLVAILADGCFPERSHARRGAIVGGWMIFQTCMVPLVYKRLRRDKCAPEPRKRAP